jgi:hypothetical protein
MLLPSELKALTEQSILDKQKQEEEKRKEEVRLARDRQFEQAAKDMIEAQKQISLIEDKMKSLASDGEGHATVFRVNTTDPLNLKGWQQIVYSHLRAAGYTLRFETEEKYGDNHYLKAIWYIDDNSK